MMEQTNFIFLTNIIDVMFNIFEIGILMMRLVYHLPLHPNKMPNTEKEKQTPQLREEAYHAWLNQPPIQFPLRPYSPIRNAYSNGS